MIRLQKGSLTLFENDIEDRCSRAASEAEISLRLTAARHYAEPEKKLIQQIDQNRLVLSELSRRELLVLTEVVMETSFEQLLNSQEAAKLLGVHPKTLIQMARRGEIPAVRIGKFWRFRASALDSWIKSEVSFAHGRAYRETQENDL